MINKDSTALGLFSSRLLCAAANCTFISLNIYKGSDSISNKGKGHSPKCHMIYKKNSNLHYL